ncbi:MAG TPA: F0F1 ATP synthase subunit epsilon [Acidimicrobiia bacterium]|nr:F0F1 ATP synthase subunit epsilon [Acidimicrobiia bacterium]
MAKPFRVDVVSPEATVWSGEATFVVARTPDGEIGIMADHEPLLASLVTSAVEVEGADGSRTVIGVHGGFLQVLRNQVTLLTDRAQISLGTKEEGAQLATTLAAQGEPG